MRPKAQTHEVTEGGHGTSEEGAPIAAAAADNDDAGDRRLRHRGEVGRRERARGLPVVKIV
jgi:hypothetical protein